jgi:O-antigen ligase
MAFPDSRAAPGGPPVSAPAGTWHLPGGRQVLSSLGFRGLLAAVGLATAVAAISGEPALAAVPVLLVAAIFAMTKAPLRLSAAALLFVMLGVEDNSETLGQWRTPLALVGDLFHNRLDEAARIPGLAVTGMELVVVFLFGIWAYRHSRASTMDVEGQVPAARVIYPFLALYLAGVILSEVVGLARGLSLAPWKLRNLLHPLLLGVFFLVAHRGPRDYPLLGRVVVLAACARAVLAIVVQRVAIGETGGKFATATNHGDSVLFAVAVFLLVASALEQPDRRRLLRAALLLPLLVLGVQENGRRIAWVMLAFAPVIAYVASPVRGWKRALTRVLLVAVPVAGLYVGVGWNRSGAPFGPVQTLRGLVDTKSNRSSYWREVETWNIATTIRETPLLGTGLGGEYHELMMNDDISGFYKEYKQWPHNTVLGLLMLMGLFGFTATWVLQSLIVFLAVRSYRMSATPELRTAALGCLGAVTACGVMAWGDTGAHYTQYKVFFGLALAVSARLAVATGAWPTRPAPADGPGPGGWARGEGTP